MTPALNVMVRSQRAEIGVGAALVVLICLEGCGGATAKDDHKAPLRIAAASDLRNVFPRLAERFKQRSGVTATPTFGASGQLAEQIKQGAPFDVFLAANQPFVDDLAAHGLIGPDSVRPYARGSLVLAIYREFEDQIRSLEDLTKPVVKRIALANPDTAPYGKAGKQWLERAHLFEKLNSKIVLAESVGQAFAYVQKGDVEAALIGKAISRAPEIRVVEIDANLYEPLIQALGILTSSERPAQAKAFAEFVLGEEGRGILTEFDLAPSDSATLRSNPHQKADPAGENSHE